MAWCLWVARLWGEGAGCGLLLWCGGCELLGYGVRLMTMGGAGRGRVLGCGVRVLPVGCWTCRGSHMPPGYGVRAMPARSRAWLWAVGGGGTPGAAPAHWCCVPTSSPLSFKDITTLELSCMAEYGGPVFPYIALGGYPGEWVGAVGWDGV